MFKKHESDDLYPQTPEPNLIEETVITAVMVAALGVLLLYGALDSLARRQFKI